MRAKPSHASRDVSAGPWSPTSLVLWLAAAATPPSVQRPSHDLWQRAIPLGGVELHTGSTAGATPDGAGACDDAASPRAPDVWYVYTPATSAPVRVGTRAGHPGFALETSLSLHALDARGELVEIACDDSGLPPLARSLLAWTPRARTPYFIRVSGKSGAAGDYLLEFLPPGLAALPPPNATAETALSIGPGDHHGFTRAAAGPKSSCLPRSVEGAWFSYTPAASGTATVRTDLFAHYDTALEIHEDGVLLRCEDSSGAGEHVKLPVRAGARYLIHLASGDGSSGVYGLRLEGPALAGETCGDAEPIAAGRHLVSLVGAAPSMSVRRGRAADPDRYFRYVAPAAGTLHVSTRATATSAVQGYAVEAAITLHAACPSASVSELDKSRGSGALARGLPPAPSASTPVAAGQEVLIRLSARALGQLGPIRLDVELDP
jgi:hypothetical protein